jgi:hypothetical protein
VRRRLLNLLMVLSLLMFVATCVLWVRSFIRSDMAGWITFEGGHYDGHVCESWASSNVGEVVLSRRHRWFHYTDGPPAQYSPWPLSWFTHPADETLKVRHSATARPPHGVYFAGFSAGRYESNNSSAGGWARERQTVVSVPHWFLAAVLLAPAAKRATDAARAARRRRLASLRRCGRCGYDLRATPKRCPECGSPVGTAMA